jgi:uncharacterized Zn-binding protein involved in type VI secretion
MQALITVGCMTDHGGIIVLGDSSFVVEGKAVHLEGMTHFCPKCKVQSRAIASNAGFMIVGGKSIVAVGDSSTCGSKYFKVSDLVVMSNGFGSERNSTSSLIIANKLVEPQKEKLIEKIYWSYGDKFIPLEEKSRFFDDLNLHVETLGYSPGESVDIKVNPESSEIYTFQSFTVYIKLDPNGKGIFKNVFQGKTIIIDTEY